MWRNHRGRVEEGKEISKYIHKNHVDRNKNKGIREKNLCVNSKRKKFKNQVKHEWIEAKKIMWRRKHVRNKKKCFWEAKDEDKCFFWLIKKKIMENNFITTSIKLTNYQLKFNKCFKISTKYIKKKNF